MDFFEVTNERHSVRAFKPQDIEADKFQKILETINRAPSAGNLQSYEVYVVTDTARKTALVQASWNQEFLAQAPIVFVFCAHGARAEDRYGKRGTSLYCIQDATIACTFAMLAISALELATVWVGAFNEEMVRQIICAPDDQRPIAILPVGYANETPRIRPRRSLDDLIHYVR